MDIPEAVSIIKGVIYHAIFAPIPLIRRKHIINCLRKCGVTSEETAMTLSDWSGS